MTTTHCPPARYAPAHDYLALKAATRDLVRGCGGPQRVEGFSRVKASHLSEAGAAHYPDRFAAIDQVLDMELDCGTPFVTRALAAAAGFDLVRRDGSNPQDPYQQLTALIRAAAEVQGLLAESLADGRISAAEARKILAAANAGATELQACAAQMNAIIAKGGV